MKKTNSERMAVIETEITNINKNLDDHVEEQREDFKLMFKKIDNLNKQFAGKWVETLSLSLLAMAIGGFIVFFITKGG